MELFSFYEQAEDIPVSPVVGGANAQTAWMALIPVLISANQLTNCDITWLIFMNPAAHVLHIVILVVGLLSFNNNYYDQLAYYYLLFFYRNTEWPPLIMLIICIVNIVCWCSVYTGNPHPAKESRFVSNCGSKIVIQTESWVWCIVTALVMGIVVHEWMTPWGKRTSSGYPGNTTQTLWHVQTEGENSRGGSKSLNASLKSKS